MVYDIAYSRAAEKYLDSQNQQTRKRIMNAVEDLPKGNVIKLNGRDGYRLTVGGFRVLFDYVGKSIIDVIAIGPRGDIYKK